MKTIDIQYCKTEMGELIIGSFDNKLCLLDFRYRKTRKQVDNRIKNKLQAEFIERDTVFLRKVRRQIKEYLLGGRKDFDIPTIVAGTDFQKSVWKSIEKIGYGRTMSYLMLAEKIGNKKAVRAVANAVGANALGIVIPCHRVVESSGGLGGYAGGVAAKKRLLNLENNIVFSCNMREKVIGSSDVK